MGTRNVRTAEYKSYNDPQFAGLKITPTVYGIPPVSSVVLTDIDGSGNKISVNQGIVPVLATATVSPATTAVAGSVDSTSIGKWLRIPHDYPSTYNVLPGFPKHAIISGVQAGSGQITFACPVGGINPVVGYNPKTRARGAVFALVHLGNNVWDLMGDLEKTV